MRIPFIFLLLLCTSRDITAFLRRHCSHGRLRTSRPSSLFYKLSGDPSSSELNNGDESDDEEENSGKAYRNRSLFWTNKYRRLFPYEQARISVLSLGFRSKQEWDEYVADGKQSHGAYLPNHPDEMYVDDWVSWEEWLGIMRPYEEAKHIVQHVLKLGNLEEYMRFVDVDPKRAEKLRIPYKPHIVYREAGWDLDDFFGSMQ